jgi:hypothetical protein
MSDVVSIPSGDGEVVGDSPDRRVEILSDHDTLHATSILRRRTAAGRRRTPSSAVRGSSPTAAACG